MMSSMTSLLTMWIHYHWGTLRHRRTVCKK